MSQGNPLEVTLQKTASALHTKLKRIDLCDADEVTSQLSRLVAENLSSKRAMKYPLDAERIRRQVIEAEAFKLEAFASTGVFPKRYFGYLYRSLSSAFICPAS